jgi:hypothetical protein
VSTRTADDEELDEELDAQPGETKRDRRGNRRNYSREYERRKQLRRERGETKTDAKPRKNAGGKRSLEGDLRGFLELGGRVWSIRDPECGPALVAQSGAIAKALNLTAQNNDAVYQWLDGLLSTGGGAGLAMALWPVLMRVAQHHVFPALARRRGAMMPEDYERPLNPEDYEAERLADEERLNADLDAADLAAEDVLGEATRPP